MFGIKTRPADKSAPASSPPRTWYFDIPAAAFKTADLDGNFTVDLPEDEVQIGDIVMLRKYILPNMGYCREGVIIDGANINFEPWYDGPHRLYFGEYGPPRPGQFRCIHPSGKVSDAMTSLYIR